MPDKPKSRNKMWYRVLVFLLLLLIIPVVLFIIGILLFGPSYGFFFSIIATILFAAYAAWRIEKKITKAILTFIVFIIAAAVNLLFLLSFYFTLPGCGAACPASCLPTAGYLCTNIRLFSENNGADSGKMALVFGQSTGAKEYNIGFACSVYNNAAAIPTNWQFASKIVGSTQILLLSTPPTGSTGTQPGFTLVSGQPQTFNGLTCYDSMNNTLSNSLPIGTPYAGTLWLNYTANNSTPNSTINPWKTIKIGFIRTRAS